MSAYDFCESKSKNLVAFLCLPKELIIPQEATDWLPTMLHKLRPLSGRPPPNTGLLQYRKETTDSKGSIGSRWSRRQSTSIPGSPALLTCPGPCPLKKQNLALVNDCSFKAENPFKSRSPKARMSQQLSEISRTPIVKKNNRPAPFIRAKSLLIAGQAKLQAASPWNTNTQTGLSHSPA